MAQQLNLLKKLKKIREDWFYRLNDWEKWFISEMYDAIFDPETHICSIDLDTTDEDLEEFSNGRYGQKAKINEIYEALS